MTDNLIIVESATKARTIEKFLGPEYRVLSCNGHVRDLPKNGISVDIENGYTPTYVISKGKHSVLNEIRRMASKFRNIFLASDDDREGEAISWHIMDELKLPVGKARRIVFREITKAAIQKSILEARDIDNDLVHSQQARRVLDRLVGYEISPLLWKKIKFGLSAGRVQSVALRIISERELEILDHMSKRTIRVRAVFSLPEDKRLAAEASKRFEDEKDFMEFFEQLRHGVFHVESINVRAVKKSPPPPFITSTLQQECSRKFGYSLAFTMSLAQKLYERGHISYMRTDSLNLSAEALAGIKGVIIDRFGAKYARMRKYSTRDARAQEAHEAIRPTQCASATVSGSEAEKRLYSLIWSRAIASQMADADIEKTTVTIGNDQNKIPFSAKGEVIRFPGFLTLYQELGDEGGSSTIPSLQKGLALPLVESEGLEVLSAHPPRYTEGSLVKKLESLGIGRPSTYAPTVSTVVKRGYAIIDSREGKKEKIKKWELKEGKISSGTAEITTGAEKKKLFPTDTGIQITEYLKSNFENIVDYAFTAKIEEEFDQIARGDLGWSQMIDRFYKSFHPQVLISEKSAVDVIKKSRYLGDDPKTGKKIFARLGPFGAYVQLGDPEQKERLRAANLRKDQYIQSITLEEALQLLAFPRTLGTFEDEEVVVSIGRFGPYLKHKGGFVSLKDPFSPHTVTFDEAVEVIHNFRREAAEKNINSFLNDQGEEIQVLNGRFGPYLRFNGNNVRIPKTTDAKKLNLEDCLDLIKNHKPRKGRYSKAKK